MKLKKCFLESEIGVMGPEESFFHVIPVPYEKTVSYGSGTGNAPEAVIEASQQLEIFNGKNYPSEKGIHTKEPVDCSGKPSQVIDLIKKSAAVCFADKKIPVIIGGEHTVTTGAVQAATEAFDSFGVIQFDAHADLRDTYESTRYSHACVMRRVYEMDVPFLQVGTRSFCPEETAFRAAHGIPHFDAKSSYDDFAVPNDFPDLVYITIDVDVFDISLMPATGTPEPGGMLWYDFFAVIEKIAAQKKIIGFDLVELAPIKNFHAYDYLCARLIYNMMGYVKE